MKRQPQPSDPTPLPAPGSRLERSEPMRGFFTQRGVTLIELIMVIVVMGILAVYAAPRMFNTGDFYARGFHDETLALLRYAQKTAVAQRRTVCVAFTQGPPGSAVLTIATVPASPVCSLALAGPNQNCAEGTPSGDKACINAKPDIWYSTTPPSSSLNFDGLGQPVDSALVPLPTKTTIQVANAASAITVEATTGYVHD